MVCLSGSWVAPPPIHTHTHSHTHTHIPDAAHCRPTRVRLPWNVERACVRRPTARTGPSLPVGVRAHDAGGPSCPLPRRHGGVRAAAARHAGVLPGGPPDHGRRAGPPLLRPHPTARTRGAASPTPPPHPPTPTPIPCRSAHAGGLLGCACCCAVPAAPPCSPAATATSAIVPSAALDGLCIPVVLCLVPIAHLLRPPRLFSCRGRPRLARR